MALGVTRGNPTHRNQFLRTCERDKYGCIVTARVNGKTISRTLPGKTLDALREIIEKLEQSGAVEILSISTPGTVYGDLSGERRYRTPPHPEPLFLRRIGKLRLWVGAS